MHCSYEELTAISAGATRVLSETDAGSHVAAPPEALADLEALLPRLTGDLSMTTLAEQQKVERALDYLQEDLRDRMEERVLLEYVGSEDSVTAYFEYAHVLTVRERVRRMGREMVAMIELMTGEAPTAESAHAVTFPDD